MELGDQAVRREAVQVAEPEPLCAVEQLVARPSAERVERHVAAGQSEAIENLGQDAAGRRYVR